MPPTDNSEILNRLNKAREPRPPKEKKFIPKVSKKKQAKIDEEKELAKLDTEFYKEMWLAWPHKCFECGCGLGKTPANWMFHHLLFKSRYPQFRHTPENIILLCLQCHDQIHREPGKMPRTELRKQEIEKLLLP